MSKHARFGAVLFVVAALVFITLRPALADEIVFANGDRLTGTITQAAGGKVTIKTDVAGEVTVELAKVKTFSTTAPVQLHVGDKLVVTAPVAAGPDGSVQTTPPGGGPVTVAIKDISTINPPPVKWTGAVTLNGMLTRGNSNTESLGFTADAVRRAEKDRISAGAGYLYGRQEDPDTEEKQTTTNNWWVVGKYDYFFTPRFYGYAGVRVEGDQVADLNLRFTPSAGVGYQWFEGPTFNFFTEAGLAWVYEDYKNEEPTDHFALRLAYHVDWKPNTILTLFHNLEYLPSFSDPFSDYNLNIDAGLRAILIGNLFSEFKIEWRYDSIPAPGADKSDLRLLVGVGWTF